MIELKLCKFVMSFVEEDNLLPLEDETKYLMKDFGKNCIKCR